MTHWKSLGFGSKELKLCDFFERQTSSDMARPKKRMDTNIWSNFQGDAFSNSLTTMGTAIPAASGCKSIVTLTLPEGLLDININIYLLTREPHTILVEPCFFWQWFLEVFTQFWGNDQVWHKYFSSWNHHHIVWQCLPPFIMFLGCLIYFCESQLIMFELLLASRPIVLSYPFLFIRSWLNLNFLGLFGLQGHFFFLVLTVVSTSSLMFHDFHCAMLIFRNISNQTTQRVEKNNPKLNVMNFGLNKLTNQIEIQKLMTKLVFFCAESQKKHQFHQILFLSHRIHGTGIFTYIYHKFEAKCR